MARRSRVPAAAAWILVLAGVVLAIIVVRDGADGTKRRPAGALPAPGPSAPRAAATAPAVDALETGGPENGTHRRLAIESHAMGFDAEGFTALDAAARAGRVEEIRRLAAAGADLDQRDHGRNGWTALMHAAHKEQPGAVRALLALGADPNATAPSGVTTLMIACGQGEADLTEMLLASGADPRAANRLGVTALTNAVANGDPLTVRALLRHAPDLHLSNTVPDWASRVVAVLRGHRQVLSILDAAAARRPAVR
jgi:uncharacterized protein